MQHQRHILRRQSQLVADPSLGPYGRDFAMVVRTTGASESFTIPTINVGTFNADVSWGDGSTSAITAHDDPDLSHTYAVAGDYTIRISGSFPAILFNNGGDRLKVRKVLQLGRVGWVSLASAFYGCSNIDEFTIGECDTSGVANMSLMFAELTSLTTLDLRRLDMSGVTNASSMINGCTALTSLDMRGVDTSSVTNFSAFCINNGSLVTARLSGLDTSSAENMSLMFFLCTEIVLDPSGFDIRNVTNLSNFATGVTIDTAAYDATLIAWSAQDPNNSLTVNFGSSKYTAGAAAAARASLISNDLWTISDGGQV